MADTVFMAEPVRLIESDSDGKLRVVPSALDILNQIDQHVVVVAVVGLYRTGKSYLMNKLAGKNKGFALGSTVQSKTKGIWMWCVPHPDKADHTLVLLDTEGLGDVEKGDKKDDGWIFALAVLLSSTLVYNSKGTIDNNALEDLHYVTELTEHIKVKSEQGKNEHEASDYMQFFPSFVWAVRDFTLELKLDDKPITADEYLENALKLKKGHSQTTVLYNLPRSCLQDYFYPRWCFVFQTPANPEKMIRMEELTDADLEPNFVKQAKSFCSHIFTNAKAKTLKGSIKATGRLLGSMAVTYTDAIRSGDIPCLDNAVLALAEIENTNAVERARVFYQKNMEDCVVYPTETQEELSAIHAQKEKEALAIFMKNSFNDKDQKYQTKLGEVLQAEYNQICENNCKASQEACDGLIEFIFAPVEEKLSAGTYMTPGGYRMYYTELKFLTTVYRSESGKGVMANEVLKVYLDGKESFGQAILEADKSLTEAARLTKEEEAKREQAERECNATAEQLRNQERVMEDQKKTMEQHVTQLKEKMEADKQSAKEEFNRVLQAQLTQQKDLLQRGFDDRAHRMQRDIDHNGREEGNALCSSTNLCNFLNDLPNKIVLLRSAFIFSIVFNNMKMNLFVSVIR